MPRTMARQYIYMWEGVGKGWVGWGGVGLKAWMLYFQLLLCITHPHLGGRGEKKKRQLHLPVLNCGCPRAISRQERAGFSLVPWGYLMFSTCAFSWSMCCSMTVDTSWITSWSWRQKQSVTLPGSPLEDEDKKKVLHFLDNTLNLKTKRKCYTSLITSWGWRLSKALHFLDHLLQLDISVTPLGLPLAAEGKTKCYTFGSWKTKCYTFGSWGKDQVLHFWQLRERPSVTPLAVERRTKCYTFWITSCSWTERQCYTY